MPAHVLHNHVGQAEQIDKDPKAQLDGQPVKIGHKYIFDFPTNGAKIVVVLNSRGFYHMYVPVLFTGGKSAWVTLLPNTQSGQKMALWWRRAGMHLFANLWKTKTCIRCFGICITRIRRRVSICVCLLDKALR